MQLFDRTPQNGVRLDVHASGRLYGTQYDETLVYRGVVSNDWALDNLTNYLVTLPSRVAPALDTVLCVRHFDFYCIRVVENRDVFDHGYAMDRPDKRYLPKGMKQVQKTKTTPRYSEWIYSFYPQNEYYWGRIFRTVQLMSVGSSQMLPRCFSLQAAEEIEMWRQNMALRHGG